MYVYVWLICLIHQAAQLLLRQHIKDRNSGMGDDQVTILYQSNHPMLKITSFLC
jgi:hypothetical protein